MTAYRLYIISADCAARNTQTITKSDLDFH